MALLVSDSRGRVSEYAPGPSPPTWGALLERVIRTVEVSAAAEAKASLSGEFAKARPNGARQEAAYRHWERVGEVMNATRSVARLVGKVPLVARQAMMSDSGATVYEASEVLPAHEWVRGFGSGVGGQAELAERFASELFVGGEAVLIGWNDEDRGGQWRAVSPLALRFRAPWVTIEDGTRDPLQLPVDSVVWGHCRESKLGRESGVPWSGVMAAAHVCDTIICLDRLLGVIAQVNLSPGLLLVPAEVQPPPVASGPGGTQTVPSLIEWFTASLDRAITSAVEHPRTSAELVPTVATVPGERTGEFRHLAFERKYDERVLQVRTTLADLLLVFLDVEARAVDGSLVESKYVNGELVRRSLVDSYILPYCNRLASLATGFLQQFLVLSGLPWENQIVRPDETALEPPPDSEVVLAAVDAQIIGPHGARAFFRFPEEWAPQIAEPTAPATPAADEPVDTPDDVQPEVAAAGARPPDLKKRSAMICLRMPATWRPAPVPADWPSGTPLNSGWPADLPEDAHITLAFLGDDVSDETFAAVEGAVARVAETTGPIPLRFTHQSLLGPDGTALVWEATSPELHELRQRIVWELNRDGIAWSDQYAFRPHMTLRYLEPGAEEYSGPIDPTDVLVGSGICVAGAWQTPDEWRCWPFGLAPHRYTVHAAATPPRPVAKSLRAINDADRRLSADIAVAVAASATEVARAAVRRGRDLARKRGAALDQFNPAALAAVGVDVDDVVARTVADRSTAVRQRIEVAQRKVLGALAALGAAQIDPAELDDWTVAALTGFDAATRRAIATALDDLAADDDLATIEPDEGIVRTIAAAAGGGSGLLAFVAGLVGSRLVSAGLESAGVTPRWQWIHSGNPKDFPPHADLDGVEFTSWDDPVLESAGSGFEWVGDSFSPTNGPGGPDHNGCGCVAVLVEGGSS